jgi:uncharacterized protein YjaG (DUF416 family)
MNPARWSEDAVKVALEALPGAYRTAFAAACAERLLPNYAAFSREEGWGSVSVLREALTMVWRSLEGEPQSKERIDSLTEEVKRQIPDTEEFSSQHVSAALDAGAAVVHVLESLSNGAVEPALLAASLAHDTVHMHLQATIGVDYSEPGFDDAIYGQPLMIRELERQRTDLDGLLKTATLSTGFLSALRSASEGRSSIDVRPSE